MSDVWQGPGWWLASDGKWYPADAKPGAVYAGDLDSTDTNASIGESSVATAIPSEVALDEPVAEEVPVEEAIAAPVVEESGSMPQPIVEASSGGGWQAIEEDAPATPDPDVEGAFAVLEAEDDGWTSAFDEREGAPDVAVPEVSIAAPDVVVPDVAVPDVAVPEVSAPDVAVPDVAAPDVAVPDVAVPEVSAPDVAVPDVAVPDVAVPDVAVPDVAAPAVAVPDVAVPDVAVPDVAVPAVAVPDVAVPDVAAPIQEDLRHGVGAPIERQDAWRKPAVSEPVRAETVATVPAPRGTPDVVDLAIPEDHHHEVVETPSRNWGKWLGVIAAIALVGLIGWLIVQLFSGNTSTDTNDTSTTTSSTIEEPETSAPTSDAAAVLDEGSSTDAPATTEDESTSSTTEEDSSVFDLRAGDCIVGDIGAGQVTKVRKVDCNQEHQFEVYREALIESSITSFDEDAISSYAEEVCRTSLAAYVPEDDDRNLKFKFLQPTEDSWNQEEDPDRVITCLLFDGDGDPLIGRAA